MPARASEALVRAGGCLTCGVLQLEAELPVRVHAYMPLATWPRLAALVAVEGRGDTGGFLTWGGVKAFMDGVKQFDVNRAKRELLTPDLGWW